MAHNLHGSYQSRCLPIALSAKPKPFGHETLHCDARELLKAVQIFKGIGESVRARLRQESPQS